MTYYKALFATMAANGQTDTQNDKMTKQRRGKTLTAILSKCMFLISRDWLLSNISLLPRDAL